MPRFTQIKWTALELRPLRSQFGRFGYVDCELERLIFGHDVGEQTKVILTQEGFPDPNLVKIVAGGTSESFDKLDRLLAVRAKR
jgi:hypothetical protein